MIVKILYQQCLSTLYCHDLSAVNIYRLTVELYLFDRRFHTVQIPLDDITCVGADIEETIILVGVNGSGKFRISKYSYLFSLIHVNDADLAIFAGKADIFLLEVNNVPYG